MSTRIELIPLTGVGEVSPGDDVADLIVAAVGASGMAFEAGDVVVVTHKIVSKAEGRMSSAETEEEYRGLVEAEAAAVLRRRGDLAITRTRHGFVCANAGVDRSNTEKGTAVLLPLDPDRSAHRIRIRLRTLTDLDLAVVVTDTFGRAWRRGLIDVAIGVSGIAPILDLRGTKDASGRDLAATEVAIVDELASAADLVMGKAAGIPAVVVRGFRTAGVEGRATDLIREPREDLFR